MMLAAVAVVAFVAVAGAVFWLSEQQARKMQVGIPDFSSQEFRLTDQSGASRSAADFAGAPVALFFGYTYCPDVCPMTLTLLANALDARRSAVGHLLRGRRLHPHKISGRPTPARAGKRRARRFLCTSRR